MVYDSILDELDWVEIPLRVASSPPLFVAQVFGGFRNRRIPHCSFVLLRCNPSGPLDGRILLVQRRGIADPGHGGRYTVKRFESSGSQTKRVSNTRSPSASTPSRPTRAFLCFEFANFEEDELRVEAECLRTYKKYAR